MPVDLHTHSSASDGTDTPSELVAKAHDRGLSAFALTDHDTLSGIEEARLAAERLGIDLVPGTELSVQWPTGKMHLLVYFIEPGAGPLQDELSWLRDGRDERNVIIVDRLNELGYDVTMSEVEGFAKGESVGRPHIADALVARGYFPDRNAVFDALLAVGRPAYMTRRALDAERAIELAKASGGVSVVAHPYTIGLNREEYGETFRRLADIGLTGIETQHSEQSPELRDHLTSLAADLGLVATGGSDYLGTGKPGIGLGTGRGELHVPDDVIEALRQRR